MIRGKGAWVAFYFRIVSVLSGIEKEGGKTTSPPLLVSLCFQLSFSLPCLGGGHAGKLLSSVTIVVSECREKNS